MIDLRVLASSPTERRHEDLRVAMTWLTDGTGASLEDLAVNNVQPIADVAGAIIVWLGWTESDGSCQVDPTGILPASRVV